MVLIESTHLHGMEMHGHNLVKECFALFGNTYLCLFASTQAVAPEALPSDAKPAYWLELSKPGDSWLFAKERGSAQY